MTLIPTQVTFRGLAHDDRLEDEIRERVSWLELAQLVAKEQKREREVAR